LNTETATLLVKSARAIHSAELLLAGGEPDFAAGRAYYAMFYAAEALLHLKGLRSRKHSGVHQLFWEHFVKTALIDPKFHRWLLDAFDQRLHADYAFEVAITSEDAAETIDQARQFLKEAQNFLAAP
jgi:uncharacterized protein (UPF0332 family)